jgi:hypothetical protein
VKLPPKVVEPFSSMVVCVRFKPNAAGATLLTVRPMVASAVAAPLSLLLA